MAASTSVTTVAVVAVKPFSHAKTRLATVPAPLRRRLAWCMTADTLAALCAVVDEAYVVSSIHDLSERLAHLDRIRILPEPELLGVNAALALGAQAARDAGARTMMACVGDLPALRPASVTAVLRAARPRARSFVADASGMGTTMLIADGVPLAPAFQDHSAAAHRRSGATELDLPVPDARRDVDTEADLAEALALGVGSCTQALVESPSWRRLELSGL